MTYIFLYLVIGFLAATASRVSNGRKRRLEVMLAIAIFWPCILIDIIGDWEI